MKHYVLKYPDGGFVSLDDDSGGYPYNVKDRLDMAKIWSEPFLDEMKRYLQVFKNSNFRIVQIIDADALVL